MSPLDGTTRDKKNIIKQTQTNSIRIKSILHQIQFGKELRIMSREIITTKSLDAFQDTQEASPTGKDTRFLTELVETSPLGMQKDLL
jgi:hypothetical protein